MGVAVQQLVNALALGGTYALLALGLAVIYSIMGLINFAHGELMTIAGYSMLFAITAGMPFPVVVVVAITTALVAALIMERIAFRPVRGASPTTLLLTSFAISEILQVIFQDTISARPKGVPLPDWLTKTIGVGSIQVGILQATSIVVVAVTLVALLAFLKRTTIGISMRAAAQDFEVTRLMGIRADRVVATAFAVSGVLAGIAAILWVAQRGTVDPLMGFTPVLKAFIAAVIGGLGSLPGAVAGGFLLGAVEVGFQATLPDGLLPFRDAFALIIVIGVLLVRPEGLLSRGASGVRA